VPILFPAIKAAALLKQAGPLLTHWNRLPPTQQDKARRHAQEVMASVALVRAALGERFADEEDTISWREARAEALEPEPHFLLAKQLVGLLRERGPLEEAVLAREAGLAGARDETLADALAVAADDGYLTLVGLTWQVTEFADQELSDSEHVLFLEREIVEHLAQEGLADKDELALAVGSDEFRAPDFQAALERTLTTGSIEWIRPSTYGLPVERLATLAPPDADDDEDPASSPGVELSKADPPSLSASLRALGASLHALQQTMRSIEYAGGSEPERGARRSGPEKDPLKQLQQLGQLRDQGVVTEREFEDKKADLLARL
jgi:hypothetical protein